jgi:LuxR family maltose regulon positive regulatory protein
MPEPAAHLLATKLYRPPPGDGLIVRPRLLEKLNEGLNRPLMLVVAPAGYGKTTLVTSWLDGCGFEHAWVSLDEGDSDLANFLRYLIAAARSAFPEMGQAAESALQAPILPRPAVMADLFLQDVAGLSHSRCIVLDDFHAVASQDVRAFMERLVQYQPANLHLILVARTDPLLSLGRLRGQRRITEVRGGDLRFTPDEAAALIRRTIGGDASPALIELLAERTEGWPVGLQLAAISLRESADPEAFARRFAQFNDRVLSDYLLSEVLDRLPEAQRARLLSTSILDRFCAPLCEAVSDDTTIEETGAGFIASLWRANLFITALDDEGVWYRYHHLLRDLLRHQLRQTLPAEEIAALHRRASIWFENAGLIEEAIMHAVEGNDSRRAAHLVEANWQHPLNGEDWRRLERWLALLPASVSQRPVILIARAFLQHFRHRVAAMMPLLDAAERSLNAGAADDTPAQTEALLGAINTLRASTFVAGNPEEVVRTSSLALQQLSPDMAFARSLAEFWHIYGLEQAGETRRALEQAHTWLAEQAGQPDVRTLRLFLGLCGVYHNEADLPNLLATATTYREVALRMQRGISEAWAHFLLGWAHYYRNDLASAAEYFGFVVESPYQAHGKAAVDSFIGLALTRAALGQTEAAQEVVTRLRSYLLDAGAVELVRVADSLALHLDDGPAPREAPGEFTRELEGQMAADSWEIPGLTAVRVALRSGAPDRLAAAAETLRACRGLAESRHSKRRCIEIDVLEACVHAARGDDAAVLETVRRAVLLGEPGGALRFFLDDGTALRPYLRRLLDQGVAPGYVRAILESFAPEDAALQPLALLPPPGDQRMARGGDPASLLTNREVDVLLLLEQRLTNKEIAARLMISPRTVQKHTINLYEKLHASNRREVIARARALGLLASTS